MSQSAILICPREVTPAALLRTARYSNPSAVPGAGSAAALQIAGGSDGSRWYVTVASAEDPTAFTDDYRSNDDLDPRFRDAVEGMQPLMLDFNDFESVRSLVRDFLSAEKIDATAFWLDTDFGWVLRGDRLLEKLNEDQAWDWRFEPSVYLE